ncbi:unnamed protein product [Ceratitis capitata]|uniref:(Mediterranean fruit fly) hypothetical protein n=1 Tax=Ceratitis capitata TaxID=7213 RepID=A0A811U720_CERCA|nr:unnamed protein product [Ceratitis capitata]
MESKRGERRSSLKHPDTTGIKRFGSSVETSRVNRRISFSGRKSVREFHSEEKPKTWNNSYEVSDHINTSDGSSEGYMKGAISKTQGKPNNLSLDYKENIASNNLPANTKVIQKKELRIFEQMQ